MLGLLAILIRQLWPTASEPPHTRPDPRISEHDPMDQETQCRAQLVFSTCYSLDFSLWLETRPQNQRFTSLVFLQSKGNFLNNLVTVLWSTAPSPFAENWFLVSLQVYSPVRTRKAYVSELYSVLHSFVQISDKERIKAIHNMSVCQ